MQLRAVSPWTYYHAMPQFLQKRSFQHAGWSFLLKAWERETLFRIKVALNFFVALSKRLQLLWLLWNFFRSQSKIADKAILSDLSTSNSSWSDCRTCSSSILSCLLFWAMRFSDSTSWFSSSTSAYRSTYKNISWMQLERNVEGTTRICTHQPQPYLQSKISSLFIESFWIWRVEASVTSVYFDDIRLISSSLAVLHRLNRFLPLFNQLPSFLVVSFECSCKPIYLKLLDLSLCCLIFELRLLLRWYLYFPPETRKMWFFLGTLSEPLLLLKWPIFSRPGVVLLSLSLSLHPVLCLHPLYVCLGYWHSSFCDGFGSNAAYFGIRSTYELTRDANLFVSSVRQYYHCLKHYTPSDASVNCPLFVFEGDLDPGVSTEDLKKWDLLVVVMISQ